MSTRLLDIVSSRSLKHNIGLRNGSIIMEYIKLDKDDTLELRRNLRKSDKELLRRIGVEYRQIHGPKKLLGEGWSITEGELDLPEESCNFAVVHRK